ncbi:hypothetical protein [Jiangella mangrovi]|uniref:Uncharacterized protein n=1 Tax=Jiangella mangrovi TaxID=1524084 RepID=A0A7W9LP50_9ACTN|nr:hypothetical protein [Jiangella mangrovi]MBB5791023.1 hypothetical protein [Jiangella mangrovi]
MRIVESTAPLGPPPSWAVQQRRLLDDLAPAARVFAAKYLHDDGSLIWRDELPGRDGLDDGYESVYDWPLAYLLGADDDLMTVAARAWAGITTQFTRYGQALDEYERGYDWFHQGEGNLLLYHLCLADPAAWRDRVARFAGLYTDPAHGNYDPVHRLIRAAHTGSGGPRYGPYRYSHPFTDDENVYEWSSRHEPYGLPFRDLPGIDAFADLKDPANARLMGAAMHERLARGDTVVNLTSTGLVTLAYATTGDERLRDWVIGYVDAWRERAAANGGLIPDNVGLSGEVGEYLGGRWYGGHYGWSWPHGLEPIASAIMVAASSAYLLTADPGHLELPRRLLRGVLERGRIDHGRLVVPHRHDDSGWFDFRPLPPRFALALWHLSGDPADRALLDELETGDPDDWTAVPSDPGRFRDAGTRPWLTYLSGANADYPRRAAAEAAAQVARQTRLVRADDADPATYDLHHWQQRNPVTTEALVQLTLGGPAPIYNGGLLHARLRWFTGLDARRPGLPPDVAALVHRVAADGVSVRLVNLHPAESRQLVVQGGAFGEFRIDEVRTPSASWRVGSARFAVRLAPASMLDLDLTTTRTPLRPTTEG